MIFYVSRCKHAYTHFVVLHHYRPDLRSVFRSLPYENASLLMEIGEGVVIWTDMDRLTPGELESAARLSDRLTELKPGLHQLNHPTKSLQRYDLLQALHEMKINGFRAFRAENVARDLAFPVFIRDEVGATHRKPQLIENELELGRALDDTKLRKMTRPIVVEYVSSQDAEGYYRKYSAYRVGSKIYAQHCFATTDWFVKLPANKMRKDHVAELHTYVANNPHRDVLTSIFEIANMQYGRIDYTLIDGRVQVFEINSNPTVLANPPTPYDAYDSLPYADVHADALLALPHAGNRTSSEAIDAIDARIFAGFRRSYWRKRVRLTVRKGSKRLREFFSADASQ